MPTNTLFPAATTVGHIKRVPEWWRTDEHFVFIGRQKEGMHFGNPFSAKSRTLAGVRVPTRETSIDCFRRWLLGEAYQDVEQERRRWILSNLHLLRGKTLVCFCHPQTCHGDVLARLADQ
jgi:hypothetical protein